jgi:hypothetical protein
MIKLIGWITLIGLGLYFGIIQAILLFGAMVLTMVAGLLSGGVI